MTSLRHALEEAHQSSKRLEQDVAGHVSAQEAADVGLKAKEKELIELQVRNSHMHQAVESAKARIAELQVQASLRGKNTTAELVW